jgi:hypothetical protein
LQTEIANIFDFHRQFAKTPLLANDEVWFISNLRCGACAISLKGG